ncbi:MAG: DUF4157 domain-containing protein [Myxococcales bacterium]|nr:DUF4157 domain-containing protein [Myxococcales bacterium]
MRGPGLSGAGVQAAAAKGVSGGGGQIPHHDAIQASFGSDHDVGAIDSHVGGAAADASKAMGAQAYATGNSVAFSSAPDLHTAAHEAAHVQQQKAGVVQLKGGVGEAGDAYEKNADEVADRVVQGKSAADLLPGGAGGGGGGVQQKQGPVQMLGDSLDAEVSDENRPNDSLDYHRRNDDTGEWENKPMEGEVSQYDYSARKNKTVQRRYTFGQYQAMWEKERGRPMNETELATLNRGCIGITVLNLGGSGNPPLDEAYNTFDQGHARMEDLQKTIKEHPDMSAADAQAAGFNVNFSGKLGDYKSVMFAKLFWSNQQAKPSQEAFNAGSHEWNDEHKWEKASLVLPNGLTVEAMMKDQGRQAVIDYVYNDLGKDEFQRLTKANHDANVSAYYLAWARAMEDKDPDRFPVDEATGKVDMSGYLYQSRPKIKKNKESGQDEYSGGYVNFDYGFWDDGSNCFWHANHMQYPEGDERRDKQPMIVLQSTREKFIKGYFDFDRVIFCVGLTKGYDPASAADTHQ